MDTIPSSVSRRSRVALMRRATRLTAVWPPVAAQPAPFRPSFSPSQFPLPIPWSVTPLDSWTAASPLWLCRQEAAAQSDGYSLGAGVHAEFVEDARHVGLDGALGDVQVGRDLFVGRTLGH